MIFFLLIFLVCVPQVSAQWLPFPGPGNSVDTVTTFTDDCARADESPLSKSGAWTKPAGATVNDVNLVSNKAKGSTADENIAMVGTPTFPATQRAKITYVDGDRYTRVWVRLSDSGGYMLTTDGGNTLEIFRVANSGAALTYTQLGATLSPSRPLISGDTLELVISGTTLDAYFNDVLLGSRSDATYATGQPGLGSFGAVNIASHFQATSAPY